MLKNYKDARILLGNIEQFFQSLKDIKVQISKISENLLH